MPLSVDQLRQFDSNWGNLLVQQDASGTQVKGGGLRHALASLFRTDAAQARNKATYTAIRNAIMQSDQFFDPEVKAKADELLKGLDNGSRIKASTIKSIISQLDEMSTPEKQLNAVKKAAIGHLAAVGVPGNIPASVQDKYKELAAEFAAYRSDPKASMASIKVDQRVTEFNRMMHGIFKGFDDNAEAAEVFCQALSKLATGGASVSVGNLADKLQTLADAVRDNMRELDEIGNSRGDAIRNCLLSTLKESGALLPGALTAIADKGAALPKCGLDELNGQSGAGAMHRAVSKMAEAMDKARAELPAQTMKGLDDDALGACLVKSAMVRLPENARRNLLAALESNDGMNLLGYYAQHSDNPKAQNMKLVYSSLLTHLRAEFNVADPGVIQTPAVDANRLPPDARCAFSTDDIFKGGLSQEVKDHALKGSDIETAADPVATLGKRMASVAKAKVFMQMVEGMQDLFEKTSGGTRTFNIGKADTAFDRDLDREGPKGYLKIQLPNGTVTPRNAAQGRDALVQFITGNPAAKFENLDAKVEQQAKIMAQVQLLMTLLHQGSADTATRSVGLACRPGQEQPRVLCSQGGGRRAHEFVVSRDDNGAIAITYQLRFTSPMIQLTDKDSNMIPKLTSATSTADFSMQITIPAGNLQALGGAGWSTFAPTATELFVKENGDDPTRFDTLQNDLPSEFQFTGDVNLSFGISADEP